MSHSDPKIFTALLAVVLPCCAQTPQPALTPDDLKYFGFVLAQVAGASQPNAPAAVERRLFHLYGLNTQETAILRGASLELRALMNQLSPAARSIQPDRNGKLSAANQAALSALAAQRDQKIELLANRILSQVRPQVAALFRLNGRVLSTRGNLGSIRR